MADFFEDGLDMLEEVLREEVSEPISYTSGSKECTLQAMMLDPEVLLDIGLSEVAIEHDDADWRCCTEDLIFGTTVTKPKAGDRITRANGEVYEIRPKGKDQCWEPSGRGRFLLIHTKQIQ